MPFYPVKINQRFLSPQHAGEVADPTSVGASASFVCGAVLEISLKVENNKIVDAKFQAAGCGFLFAAADVLCEKVAGESVNRVLNVLAVIADELGQFDARRKHCAELVWQAWQTAINNFRRAETAGWNGDEALICTCFGVSEKTIENAIEKELLSSVEQVTLVCKAGGGCGSCQPLIQEILDDFWRHAV